MNTGDDMGRMRRGAKRQHEFDYGERAREKNRALGSGAYSRLWNIVDGGVKDALKAHPDYLTPKGLQSARTSIVKRVTGTVIGFAEQSAKGRGNPAETEAPPQIGDLPATDASTSVAGANRVRVGPIDPRCRVRLGSVRIKPAVSRANHWGPVGRIRAAARIEATADLMRVAAVARAARAEQGRA